MTTQKSKWELNRAGLLNFWYYDDEEFHFSSGKLLLRGANGSGKSVTMQSFIPLLLDGRKSPDRLDPFGSRARRIEDYLLGEKEIVDRDERTGYLYLEYKRAGANQYLTTGIGLQAKRYSNLNFWGFVILDNRRIGRDFFLYKTEYNAETGQEEKIPLSRRELENRLQSGGVVVRTQGEYMELVNRYVFGFESLEAYEELIKLLVQLRSPKLSKDFKPTVIYEILDNSLPGLTDDELRPLSDTIESMDQIKQQLDQLEREQASLTKVCQQYTLYNQVVLAEKAQGLLQAHAKQNDLQARADRLQHALTRYNEEQACLESELAERKREQKVLEEEERRLRDHDVFRAEEQKKQLETRLSEITRRIQHKESSLREQENAERRLTDSIREEESRQGRIKRELTDLLDSLENEAEEAGFQDQHILSAREFEKDYLAQFSFDLWKHDADSYRHRLEEVLKVIREESKARERYQDADRELGEARQELDRQERSRQKWEQMFEEEKDRWLAAFHQWRKANQELVLSDEEVQVAAQRAVELYERYQFDEVRAVVSGAFGRFHSALQSKLVENSHLLKQQEKAVAEKQSEIQEWKQKKDPEPPRHPAADEARDELKKAGIPFVPFFAAVEFKSEVPAWQRERIESAVAQMGLLDALIVPEKHLGMVPQCDKVIKPNPQLLAHTLADFLEPTPVEGSAVSAEDIDSVLRSILVDRDSDGTVLVPEEGVFRIGLIEGHAPPEQQSVYIGKEARRQYRLREIARLEAELAELEKTLGQLKQARSELEARVSCLQAEYEAFPSADDVREAYLSLEEIRRQVQSLHKEVDRKNAKMKDALEKWQLQARKLRETAEGLSLDLDEAAYETARSFMYHYIQDLQKLELSHKELISTRTKIQLYEDQLDMVMAQVDELKGELNVLRDEHETLRLQLQTLEQHLKQMGIEEIRDRINQVIGRLNEIPAEIEQLARKIQRTADQVEATEKDIAQTAKELKWAERFTAIWERVFAADDRLVAGFSPDSPVVDIPQPAEGDEVLNRAEAVWQKYGCLLTESGLDRGRVAERLNRVFYEERDTLVEYRLAQESALEEEELPEPADSDILSHQVEQLRQKSRRVQLLMDYNGKRVSPYYVLAQIDRDIELQQRILDDKDRELYEEIIMNSVGRIIRARIYRAEQWVKKINQLMKERNSSSGLTFSIRWKPRTAEHDDEMDTRDLVDLLRSDPRLLKEADMQRVTRHFRSKVNRAKQLVEENGYADTLHQTIRDMLDYRQWFSFTLYFQREGEPVRELTNNRFDQLSGGEKAMAMYIPLFSAVYSRYMEARDDAPFIISLDEAFAGVDENNIRDMFDLVEKLGFNYIMNSQALWGDYDTVPALSIYELVRPKNAPFVTVVRYHWNGKVRELLSEPEEYELSYAG